MGIYRCNGCGYVAELASDNGVAVACPRCGRENPVYDTIFFVRKLLEKYFALRSAYKQIQAELDNSESVQTADAVSSAPTPTDARLDGIDLHNTNLLSTDEQHRPINAWFAAKKIAVTFNCKAIDTSGFFDEAAMEIGRNLDFYKPVLDQIRFAQMRGFSQVNIALDKRAQKDAQTLVGFCRQLYEYSLLAKCFYQKTERVLRLSLQPSAPVRDFFSGEWLEWFALMQTLELCQELRVEFSCARNLSVVFPNEDSHELDLFWLVNAERPVCIECKSGEFRPLIAKYTSLSKRLGLPKDRFVLCVAGLAEEQAKGLSSMYEITLVSEKGLKAHLATLT